MAKIASASKASSENKNHQRDLATTKKVERLNNAEHADLVFKYCSSEISCVEIGLHENGPNATKELNESRIKTPRMMRTFCSRIIDQYKIDSAGIKTVGIIISGPYITCKVMSFNKGSIGLVYSSPRLKMPERVSEICSLLPPVLTLIFNCSMIVQDTIDYIKDSCSVVNLDPFNSNGNGEPTFFPPAFVSIVKDLPNKKRMHEEI